MKTIVMVYFQQDLLFNVVSNLGPVLVMPGIVVRLKELKTRRKHIKRKRGRSTVLVNQSIKNSLIQKMILLKGGKGVIMEIFTRIIIRLNLIQGINQMKEKI